MNPKVVESNTDYALEANRNAVHQGLEFIGKLASLDNFIEKTSLSGNEQNITATENEEIKITSTVDKHPTTTLHIFFVAATSKSAVSIIVVTTTENIMARKWLKLK